MGAKERRGIFMNISPIYPRQDMVAEYLLKNSLVLDTGPNGTFGGNNIGATSVSDRFGDSNSAFSFDGTDYLNVNGLLSPLAPSTEGAIIQWIENDSALTEKIIFSASNNSNSTLTELVIELDYRAGSKLYVCFLIVDGVTQWSLRTAVNSAASDEGIPTLIHLDHNGTEAKIFRNGLDTGANFTVSVDKTKWFKSVITDASIKADTVNIGSLRRNGSLVVPFKGVEDDVVLYDASQAGNALDIYNGSKP